MSAGNIFLKTLRKIYAWFEYPHRFLAVRDVLSRPGATVLDIGCGNHSPSLTKRYFPSCRYEGVDCQTWNRDTADEAAMDRFFPLDLDQPSVLTAIPDAAYDVIFCSHVLEHLRQPVKVFQDLLPKLRPGGLLYVEVPSARSLRFPPARNGWFGIRGCLNFWDDPTHRSLVSLPQLMEIAQGHRLTIRQAGRRFLWRRVLFLPCYMLAGIVLRGYIPASVVWDAVGFAEYFVAQAPPSAIALPAPHFDTAAVHAENKLPRETSENLASSAGHQPESPRNLFPA